LAEVISSIGRPQRPSLEFFDYWDSLGFFDNLQVILPPKFFVIFEIARVVFTPDLLSDALAAIEDISREEKMQAPDRDESIMVNRVERVSPLSDIMEIDSYRTIYDLKKALPRELALDDDMFDIKLATRTLLVQKFRETQADKFRQISTMRDESGKQANRFEQKFYLLLDRSRSMELRMRSFFSKCLVSEFLRRKLNSNAKIFYRPFDTKPGDLFKIEKKEDFPFLVERVLLTTTGGTSTNLQQAVYQAVSDINFDKEMINAEILVVTDGISKIDKFEMKQKLGNIKLNVLKIGDDLAEPDFFEMKKTLDFEKIDFNPASVNIKDIKRKLSDSNRDEEVLTPTERRAYRYLLDYSEKMFRDLRDVANRFVEIPDLQPMDLFTLTDDNLDFIESTVDNLLQRDYTDKTIEEMQRLYKQAYFLCQYIELLMENGDNAANPILQNAYNKLKLARQKMLQDPSLLKLVTGVKGFDEEKKTLKLARKEMRKKLKEMQLTSKTLTSKEMKKAQMVLTMDFGEGGSMGQFLMLIFIKLWEFLKKILLFWRKKDPDGEENGGTP
jgi:Mg-chelatase subunit ChlD